ncbi:MAG TPA: Flp pilus assembly protein CpaB [Phycisphaerae bacterium]|jgi:pilus assembly protein CpaB|nr:Flp pilus assembly protein CpaB [Phycisphaerae bacterium]HRS27563.1 Flp pilus assembly protein CpaB [Phycisphaerae bacterium]
MNVKSFVPLIAGLCIGGLALKIGVSTLQRAKGAPSATVQLWAPAAIVPRGTQITAEMLKAVQFPKDLVPPAAVREKDKLIGRVPHVDVPADLPILEPMLLPPGSPAGVHVPPGLRAVAVKVDEGSGVDFHLEPGCHVDVIGYFQTQDGNRRETIARTLIEDVQVAAVGARISPAGTETEGKTSRPARAVTLLVKPDAVPILHLAEQRGKIKLSMRGADDAQEIGPGRTVSDSELLAGPAKGAHNDQKDKEQSGPVGGWLSKLFARSPEPAEAAAEPAAPAPAAVPPAPANPPWVVQVYRGNQVETIQFQSRDSRERVESQRDPLTGSATSGSAAIQAGQSPQLALALSPGGRGKAAPAGEEASGEETKARPESDLQAQDQVPQEPSE